MKSYLKMDFYRMLTSKYFGIGILGVVGVYGLSLMQLKSQDVYLLNYYIKFYSTYMLLLIFGAVAYSNAMMEDLEYKNYYLQIQKGSFRKYIWSKVIAFMGMLLYTLSLFVSKIWSYVIVVVLIFLQSVFGKMGLVLDNFLPFSWISASHWRFGYDRHRPDLIYIYTAFCMLLFLLAVISEWKIKRMDWVSKEEHR